MSNMNSYIVYKHTNKINGKVYIGITFQNPKDRWGNNGKAYISNTEFYTDILKYGWYEGFNHEILEYNLTAAQASLIEISLIEKYNARNPLYGYNTAKGGVQHVDYDFIIDKVIHLRDGVIYNSLQHCAMATQRDIDTIKAHCKLSNIKYGTRDFMYLSDYDKLTEIEKNNVRKGLNKDGSKPIIKRNIKVVRLEDGYVFDSLKACLEQDNVSKLKLLRDCRGITNPKSIRLYMYYDDYEILTEDEKQALSNYIQVIKQHYIVTLWDGEIYKTVGECVTKCKASSNSIKSHCNGFLKDKSKQLYMYLIDYQKLNDIQKDTIKQRAILNHNFIELTFKNNGYAKEVIRLKDGKVYRTLVACAKDNNLSNECIREHCNCDKRIGFPKFLFKRDYDSFSENELKILLECYKDYYCSEQGVIRILDGKIYANKQECAKDNNVSEFWVRANCKGFLHKKPIKLRQYMYVSDYQRLSNVDRAKLKDNLLYYKDKSARGGCKQIIRMIDGKIFRSIQDCCYEEHVDCKTIRKHCKGEVETVYYMFLEDYEKLSKEEQQLLVQHIKDTEDTYKIVRLTDAKIYDSISLCAVDNNMSLDAIRRHCDKRYDVNRFMRLFDYNKLTEFEKLQCKENALKVLNNRIRDDKVIQLSNKQVFNSFKECLSRCDVTYKVLSTHCLGKVKKPQFMYLSDYITKYGDSSIIG